MFSITSLLVLACACAVIVNAQECVEVKIGTQTDNVVNFEPQAIANRDTDVQIPEVCISSDDDAGAKAIVCDYVAPTAYFTDLHNLYVHRNGELVGYATANVTYYCWS